MIKHTNLLMVLRLLYNNSPIFVVAMAVKVLNTSWEYCTPFPLIRVS